MMRAAIVLADFAETDTGTGKVHIIGAGWSLTGPACRSGIHPDSSGPGEGDPIPVMLRLANRAGQLVEAPGPAGMQRVEISGQVETQAPEGRDAPPKWRSPSLPTSWDFRFSQASPIPGQSRQTGRNWRVPNSRSGQLQRLSRYKGTLDSGVGLTLRPSRSAQAPRVKRPVHAVADRPPRAQGTGRWSGGLRRTARRFLDLGGAQARLALAGPPAGAQGATPYLCRKRPFTDTVISGSSVDSPIR